MTGTSSNNLFANLGQSQTDNTQTDDLDPPAAPPNELEMLKARARIMGIKFSNAIKVETLRAKINAALDNDGEGENKNEDENEGENLEKDEDGVDLHEDGTDHEDGEDFEDEGESEADEVVEPVKAAPALAPKAEPAPVPQVKAAPAPAPAKKLSMREQLVAEQTALVRCRITNLDPKKADLPGEIFTVANEYIGTIRKYIPYGEVTDDGYHIPVAIYNQLIERTFVSIKTVKNKNGRGATTVTQDAREFAIEVMPQLTPDELARLANAQAAAAGN